MKSVIKKSLIIRRATEADIDEILLFEARNQLWFAQFLPQKALEKLDRNYFKKQFSGSSQTWHYLIYSRNKQLIGRFCAQLLDAGEKTIEISYRLEQKYTKQGIAQYVLKRLLLIFSCYEVSTVYAYVGEANESSIRLLLSCGFVHSTTEVQSIKLSTGIQDGLSFKWESSPYQVLN
ncbi:GNAT family N-acetyltransferase [Marinomonas flavescens]|uniref:GNAT family N-acetyltransferase n=1 Tax=Marinomonas flavescens TaxID=2529379 RepID=UPI0010553E73|nr:GNAT family N-acetyltransferase [Marinomonas flavescens]